MKIIGTYQIINTLDQKSYVGSSNDIERRWKEHKGDLKAGAEGRVNEKGEPMKHHNDPLQRAWTKYGADAFQFHILEINDTAEQALQDEQLLLNALFDGGKTCYNTSKDATAPMLGKHHKQESKDKMSAVSKGKSTGPFKQDRKDAISAAKKGQVPWNKGKKLEPDHCTAIAAGKKGQVPWNKGKKLGPPTQGHKDALKAAWVKRRAKIYTSIL